MEIIIKARNYNGDFGAESVLRSSLIFDWKDANEVELTYTREHCLVAEPKQDSIYGITTNKLVTPYLLSEESATKLMKIVDQIKNDSTYRYNESKYHNHEFDSRFYYYFDVIIDGESYELLHNEPLLLELMRVTRYDHFELLSFDIKL